MTSVAADQQINPATAPAISSPVALGEVLLHCGDIGAQHRADHQRLTQHPLAVSRPAHSSGSSAWQAGSTCAAHSMPAPRSEWLLLCQGKQSVTIMQYKSQQAPWGSLLTSAKTTDARPDLLSRLSTAFLKQAVPASPCSHVAGVQEHQGPSQRASTAVCQVQAGVEVGQQLVAQAIRLARRSRDSGPPATAYCSSCVTR